MQKFGGVLSSDGIGLYWGNLKLIAPRSLSVHVGVYF